MSKPPKAYFQTCFHVRKPTFSVRKDEKPRRPFILLNEKGEQIGRGVYYTEGNVQVYMSENQDAAWQMQLADVLHLKDVATFRWAH